MPLMDGDSMGIEHLWLRSAASPYVTGLPEHLSQRLKEAFDSGLGRLKRSACQSKPFCSAQPPAGEHCEHA